VEIACAGLLERGGGALSWRARERGREDREKENERKRFQGS
jgi:hypothetical protein